MCVGLCVSHIRNSKSVGAHNNLTGRKVQHRLLHQLWVGLCVSRLCNPTYVCECAQAALLEEMYSVGCTDIRMWDYVFPTFVIQQLYMYAVCSE